MTFKFDISLLQMSSHAALAAVDGVLFHRGQNATCSA